MNALTLEVILRVVFGVTDESRLVQLRPLVNRTVNVNPVVFLGWSFPRLQRFGPWRRTFENQVALDEVIYAEIAERRRATDLESRTDVLSRLMHVTEDPSGDPATPFSPPAPRAGPSGHDGDPDGLRHGGARRYGLADDPGLKPPGTGSSGAQGVRVDG